MTALAMPHSIPPSLAKSVMRITADQYHTMIEKGILLDGDPVELLDGYIVNKDRSVLGKNPMSHDPLHVLAVNKIVRLASQIDGPSSFVQIQVPVALSPLYEPEPDASIIRGVANDYRKRLAAPSDILCLIEVAHSSLDRDQGAKLTAYAAAGITQYLIVNLQTSCVEVYTDPDAATSTYRSKATVAAGQSVALYLGNSASLEVAASDMLP